MLFKQLDTISRIKSNHIILLTLLTKTIFSNIYPLNINIFILFSGRNSGRNYSIHRRPPPATIKKDTHIRCSNYSKRLVFLLLCFIKLYLKIFGWSKMLKQLFLNNYFWIIGSAQETPITLSSRQEGVNGSSSTSSPQRLSERPTTEWTTNDVKNLVETALAPRLEAKLRQKRREDRERLGHILQASSFITDLHSSPSNLLPGGRIE